MLIDIVKEGGAFLELHDDVDNAGAATEVKDLKDVVVDKGGREPSFFKKLIDDGGILILSEGKDFHAVDLANLDPLGFEDLRILREQRDDTEAF